MTDEDDPAGVTGSMRALARWLRAADQHGSVVRTVRAVRGYVPGSSGTPPNRSGNHRGVERVAQLITAAAGERPSVTRELGLTGVQIWRAATRGRRRGQHSQRERTIMFTDLVSFSEWALQAGDDQVLQLLHEVGEASGHAITDRGGTVVKSLGDGVMAVFDDTADAVAAADAAGTAVSAVTREDYRPQLRVGLHRGTPQRVRDDYLGVDVNIAARVADAAAGGEILISGPTLAELDSERYRVRRRRRFRAKGTPKDLAVYSIVPRHTDPLAGGTLI